MSYVYKKQHVAQSKYSIKCPFTMVAEFITIHNTANSASAKNEASYHNSNNNQVSYHIAIDDIEAIEVVPLNRNAWHCGDGNGNGNRKSIGIEICYSKSGGEKYIKAEENAVLLTAKLLHERGWNIDRVKKHQDWSGKYCPHRILDNKSWTSFLNRIQVELDKLNKKPSQPTQSPTIEIKGVDIVLNNTGRIEARQLIKRACQEGVFDAKSHTEAKINGYSDGDLVSYVIAYVNRKLK